MSGVGSFHVDQTRHLTGKAAPADFIEELFEIANNFDPKMEADVVRAYVSNFLLYICLDRVGHTTRMILTILTGSTLDPSF